jgi:hypothetical protein
MAEVNSLYGTAGVQCATHGQCHPEELLATKDLIGHSDPSLCSG